MLCLRPLAFSSNFNSKKQVCFGGNYIRGCDFWVIDFTEERFLLF